MFDGFSTLAKRAVVASQDAALSMGHDFIGTEHMLLGVLAAGEGTGIRVLVALDVDPSALRGPYSSAWPSRPDLGREAPYGGSSCR